jgi:hypothetical protein
MRYDVRPDNRRFSSLKSASCLYSIRATLLIAILALLPETIGLRAQSISIYPPVLYSGINVITISAPNGLDKVTGRVGAAGQWRPLTTGLSAPYIRIMSGATFVQCGTKVTFMVYLKTPRPLGLFELRVADCDGNIKYFDFRESENWNVFREDFGNVQLGATACHTFSVQGRGVSLVVDSIVSPSPAFVIHYTSRRPPFRMNGSGVYEYDVCHTPTKPGRMQMPILVYIRRQYPAGGQTNFIVADTAYVNVTAPQGRPPSPPIAARPRTRPPSHELLAQPPMIILPPPKDTVRVIPKVQPSIARGAPIVIDTLRAAPATTGAPYEIAVEEPLTDPTTHRAILMPTARSIDSGKAFASNYDLAGFLVGYGLTDRLSLLAGFLYVPRFISYNVVATAGGRYEIYRAGFVRGALGLEGNYSRSDVSTIVLFSPYAVVSIGDDDHRASAVLGYTWRHHTPVSGDPFDRTAAVLGIGGDYRIGYHWKIAAEGYLLQSSGTQPLAFTARYFTNRFAIDAGLGLGFATEGGLDIAPVITGTWVW